MLRETVYLSFGASANYVATHFWNTQQAYFDYRPDAPPPLVDHDVSFRAGIGADSLDTYTPRALLFDVREEFGALRRVNALYAVDVEHDLEGFETVETAPRVVPSSQAQDVPADADATYDGPPRYWSDTAQTYFHPRSMVQVAAPSLFGHTHLSTLGSDSQNPTLDSFALGASVTKNMEQELAVMEDQLRWWAEDCDALQGFQVCAASSDAFGGMAASYVELLEEEYPKSERHALLLARRLPEKHAMMASMNDVLSLVHTLEHATLVTPVRLQGPTTSHVRPHWDTLHDSTAMMATMWETATLPTRLMDRTSLHDLRAQLTWRGGTSLAQMGGCLPTPLLAEVRAPTSAVDALVDAMLAKRGIQVHDQAPPAVVKLDAYWWDAALAYGTSYATRTRAESEARRVPYAEAAVARDADAMAQGPTMQSLAAWQAPMTAPCASSTFVPLAFPVGSDYPRYFYNMTKDGRTWTAGSETDEPVDVSSVPCVASLCTSPETLYTIQEAKRFLTSVLQGHTPREAYGLEATMDRDYLVELRESLETLGNAYGGVEEDHAEPGTDEEWDEEEWDIDA